MPGKLKHRMGEMNGYNPNGVETSNMRTFLMLTGVHKGKNHQ